MKESKNLFGKKSDRDFFVTWPRKRKNRWIKSIGFAFIYGILVFLLYQLFDYFHTQNLEESFFSTNALIHLLLFILAGYFFSAFWIWTMREERYKRILKKKQEQKYG